MWRSRHFEDLQEEEIWRGGGYRMAGNTVGWAMMASGKQGVGVDGVSYGIKSKAGVSNPILASPGIKPLFALFPPHQLQSHEK